MANSLSAPRVGYYLAGFAVFAAVVLSLGRSSYTSQYQTLEAAWRLQTEERAALAAGQVAEWRMERLGDAAVAAASLALMPIIDRVLDGSESDADRSRVIAWMDTLRAQYQYPYVILTDAAGRVRLSSGSLAGSPDDYAAPVQATMQAQAGTLHDAPSVADGTASLVLGIRLVAGGTLLLGIDPATFDRLALSWMDAPRGGFALVRRRGEVFELLSQSSQGDPAETALAIAAAREPGVPTAGATALAVSREVDGMSWLVVATVPRDAALAPLGAIRRRVIAIGGTLLLFGTIGIVLAWHHQLSTFRRQRVEADIERRALQGHYEFITRFGNDAIILLDGNAALVEVNDRAIEVFGYSREELLRMTIRDLRVPEALGEVPVVFATLRARGNLVFEAVYQRKDGSRIPMEASARRIEAGGREFFQSILRDISERQRADAQIRHLNRLYAVLSECSRCVVSSRTRAELFDSVCRIAAEVGGFRLATVWLIDGEPPSLTPVARAGEAADYITRISLISKGDLTLGAAGMAVRHRREVTSNDYLNDPATAQWHDEAREFGIRSSIALPLRQRGVEVGVLALCSGEVGFFDEAEAKLAAEVADSVSFALDSIEQERRRRDADAELRISRERLERVLDSIDEAYWDWRPATGEVHLSPRYHTMLGYLPGELGFGWEAWLALTHPNDAAAVRAAFDSFATTHADSFAVEHRMRCQSGAYIWVSSRGRVLERDEAGAPIRMVGTHTDITERRKLEDQFVQAQKLESVGRLAGGVAHDFNNLLTVVNGYSEIVLKQLEPGDPNWECVDAIRQAGVRAAALTQQLLAFSRKQPTQPVIVSINAAVTEFGQLLRRLVGEEVELILRLDATDDRVRVDPAQLHQMILNLVVNARDAMPGGGRVFIHSANTEAQEPHDAAARSYVVLSVTDTGLGIDEATRAQMFEPFFTTKERGKGTGLGLSMVYGAVQQAGGFIRVETEVAQGTTFAIHLPVAAADGVNEPVAVELTPVLGSAVILVVEDEDAVRQLTVDMLRTLGHTVLAAADGAAAIDVAERHDGVIDVLMTDVIMPAMDGPTVAGSIRALRPGIKVIYTSGYAADRLDERGVLGEGVVVLPKPFSLVTLGSKIREVLWDSKAPAAVTKALRRSVLVVDDEPGTRSLIADCLSGEYRVLLAADGAEAMDVLRREPGLDLMITDMFMPNQEGIETIQAARELRPRLPIIAMSGAFGGRFLETARRLGVDATLAKPIPVKVLRQAVHDALQRSLPASGIS